MVPAGPAELLRALGERAAGGACGRSLREYHGQGFLRPGFGTSHILKCVFNSGLAKVTLWSSWFTSCSLMPHMLISVFKNYVFIAFMKLLLWEYQGQ